MSNSRLFTLCGLFIIGNCVMFYVFIRMNRPAPIFINVEKDASFHPDIILPQDFLSFGIDASEVDVFTTLIPDDRLYNLTYALSPARLRLGGTMSERLIFASELVSDMTCDNCHENPSKACKYLNELCRKKFLPYYILTGTQWIDICKFVKRTNLRLLFSFNVLLRDGENWDQTNARELLEHSKYIGCDDVDWQLGNEPNSFPHTFNITITPHQLAQDFIQLRNLLGEFGYEKSLLVGPDTTRPQAVRPSCLQYMVQFLGNVTNGIDVRSWHQYYLNSKTATISEFWDPKTLDLLKGQLETMKKSTSKYEDTPMWLSETSSSYGGGAPGLSDTFSSSPMWLDKLGLAAQYNVTTVVRQSLIGGYYSVLDNDLKPLPDWWVSLLYKKFVGNRVLNLELIGSNDQRFYAHCANRKYTSDNTAITVFGMNLKLSKLKIRLNGTAFENDKLVIEQYVLSAPSNNRRSKVVLLNGKRLVYNNELPKLKPKVLEDVPYFTIPPYSLGFWVVKNTNVEICNN